MNLLSDFASFRIKHPNKKISVFFHTSAVLESADNLKKFFEQNSRYMYAFIPENCVYELRLLSECSSFSKYREKASFLLEHCSTGNAWPYRDMYTYKSSVLSSYHCEVGLFVFYEPLAASDFSQHMGNQQGVFILCYDPYSKRGNVFSAGQSIARPCLPMNNSTSVDFFKPEDILVLKDRDGREINRISMSKLTEFHRGGEAFLFKTDLMPGKIFKIYNKYCPCEMMVNKLRQLLTINSLASGCVLPTELLYRNGKCVGFVMNQVSGQDLGCSLPRINEVQRKQLIKDISLVLLELRMVQFVVTDLSAGNIHIGRDGKIRIIDCDSMEFYAYPGGGTTPPYGHPDVTEDYFFKKLRTTDHVNFSFAVVLFEIMMGWTNPLLQKGLGDTEPQWRKHKFPYANNGKQGIAAYGTQPNNAKLNVWCSKSQSVREGFEDVFNFKTTYDIGEWLKMIGLC